MRPSYRAAPPAGVRSEGGAAPRVFVYLSNAASTVPMAASTAATAFKNGGNVRR